ncbi:hypothetical protein A8139_20560 [Marinomonas primoryensis]|uniref:Transposase n=1 Tax=Marinomonas primoryensis TaxID=178399 RepID=A0A2Z4PWR0_9GAMM|nr:IS66 family transposase zinc-finger binding domain-containing protein [Marinomonas primoryensis]AWY02062.1 hypothetical protein A8139_20560 [Marinomonas primoryensis]
MKKTNIKAKKDSLPDNVDELKQLILTAQSLAEKQRDHIRRLEEIVKLFKANKFGKSSEKSAAQTELFDEAEIDACDSDLNWAAEAIEPEEAESTAPSPTTVKAGRKPIPKNFPRIIVEHDLTDEEKRCSCGCEKQHIGDEVSEQLDIVPAVIQVLQHRRKKYACKNCETAQPKTFVAGILGVGKTTKRKASTAFYKECVLKTKSTTKKSTCMRKKTTKPRCSTTALLTSAMINTDRSTTTALPKNERCLSTYLLMAASS